MAMRTGARNPNWKGGRSRIYTFYTQEFKRNNPEKVMAHKLVQKAIQNGTLIRPDKCSRCSKQCKPHGHHEDYAAPLQVIWWCQQCHNAYHRGDFEIQ
jgi:hypothetical protein